MKNFLSLFFLACIAHFFLAAQQAPFVEKQFIYPGYGGPQFTGETISLQVQSLQPTTDGGYITFTDQYHAYCYICSGETSSYLTKTDKDDKTEWSRYITDPATGGGVELLDGMQTKDGGYIAAGDENFYSNIYPYDHLSTNVFIAKYDNNGILVWSKSYKNFAQLESKTAKSIRQTSDGGYIVGGNSFFMKLDSTGKIAWHYFNISATCIRQTKDDGFVFIGSSSTDSIGLFKTDNKGNIVWFAFNKNLSSVVQTNDGNYITTGEGDNGNGCYITKYNEDGVRIWGKNYQPLNGSVGLAKSIIQTADHGYVIAGSAFTPKNDEDFWIFKINSNGNKLWSKIYGGTNIDYAESVCQTLDGSFVAGGSTRSTDKHITGNNKGIAGWIVKFSPDNFKDSVHLNAYHTARNCSSFNDISCTVTTTNHLYTIKLFRYGILYDSALNVTGKTGFHNLPPGSYYAKATSLSGDAFISNLVEILPPPDTLNSTSISPTQEKLTWQLQLCAMGYFIQYRLQSSTNWQDIKVSKDSSSIILNELEPSATYVWRIASEKWEDGLATTGNFSHSAVFSTRTSLSNSIASTLNSNKLNVSPNPAKNSFKILFSTTSSNKINAMLYDVNGKAVWSSGLMNASSINNKKVNTTSFARGVYYLKLIDENGKAINSTKVIIAN